MPMYNVPYVKTRVARSPMNIHVKEVLAHEVLLLSQMFDDTSVVGPLLDEQGKVRTARVDPNLEYQRLVRCYGNKGDSDKSRCEEVYGPPFGQAWKDALAGGLGLFDMEGDGAVSGPPAQAAAEQAPSKTDKIIEVARTMLAEDPDKQNENWWTGDGKPEVRELRNRMDGQSVSAAERNAAITQMAAEQGNGQIDTVAVMARLDDLGIEYDPDASPEDLHEQLRASTVSGIQALGGDVADPTDLVGMSEQLDELREAQ